MTRADFASEQQLGEDAIGGFRGLFGLDGAEAQQAQIDQLRQSPLYQSLYRNGLEATAAAGSATGGLRGGNQQAAFYNLGEDTLSNVIQQQLAGYGGAIGIGMGSDSAIGQFGQNAVNSQNQLRLGGAEARANGLLTRAGINAQNWNNAGSFIDSAVSAAIPGGGGFGGFLKGLF